MNTGNKLLVLALATLLSGSAIAAGQSKEQIIESALQHQAGTVERATLVREDGQNIWQVVIRDNTSEEHLLSFDADNGQLLSSAAFITGELWGQQPGGWEHS
jgi:hypothetical protein